MIKNDNGYLFTLTNDQIRKLVPFELDDDDCEGIANELNYHFNSFVATRASEWRINHPRIANTCEVIATLQRQVWGGPKEDYAMTVGEIEFECQDALDTFDLSELPPYADMFHHDGWLNYGDELFFESVRLGLVPDWDGPFECYVDDEQYDWYLEDRVLKEYGYELRKED